MLATYDKVHNIKQKSPKRYAKKSISQGNLAGLHAARAEGQTGAKTAHQASPARRGESRTPVGGSPRPPEAGFLTHATLAGGKVRFTDGRGWMTGR